MAQTGMKWYVLRAVSGKEAKVKEYLEALMKNDALLAANVGQVLLPTEKYAQLRNGKRVVKEKLFLPGYVLIEANLQGEVAHISIDATKKAQCLYVAGLGHALPIDIHARDGVAVLGQPFPGFVDFRNVDAKEYAIEKI